MIVFLIGEGEKRTEEPLSGLRGKKGG